MRPLTKVGQCVLVIALPHRTLAICLLDLFVVVVKKEDDGGDHAHDDCGNDHFI